MNAISSPLRGLVWKETRQIVPLVLMLLAVALCLITLWSILDAPQTIAQFGHYIPLLLPALFAAGAGAILVGQEKETRTMLWCSTLPISPVTIVGVKFVVALVGLLLMWFCCALIGILIGDNRLPGNEGGVANTLYWFAHSLFILCCGFYTAWRMKSTFPSLVALIPLAALPYVATSLYFGLFVEDRYISLQEAAWLLTTTSAIGCVVMGWLAYRAGIHALSPATPELEESGARHWLAAWRPANSLPVPETPFRYPLSSLVWQSIHHNRMTLAVLVILILLGCTAFGSIGSEQHTRLWENVLALAIVVGAIATSWLGVFVFHGDGSANRLRFLADRGVSPTRVWIGRHLIGVSAISLGMVAFLISSCFSLRNSRLEYGYFAPSMAMVGCVLWIIYVVSQATSQWIRILAASAFIAPVLAGVAVVWLCGAATMYDAPFWLVSLCSLLPMLATWRMMRRFMDDAAKWPIWLCGAVTTLLFLSLPVVPFMIDVAAFPGISPAAKATLIARTRTVPNPGDFQPMMSTISPLQKLQVVQPQDDVAITEIVRSQGFLPQDYLSIGDLDADTHVPLHADLGILAQSIEYAEYFRYLVMQNSEDADAVEGFGKWIDALSVMAARLRLSARWYDQEVADQVEMWLTQTLSREELQPLRSRDFSQRAIAVISDQENRNAARRRAVLLSFRDFESNRADEERDDSLGGFREYEMFQWVPQQKRHWIYDRLIDRLAVDALELIDAGESGQDTLSIRRKLHDLMVAPSTPFDQGPYGAHQNQIQPSFGYGATRYPASTWYGEWEGQAKQLGN